MSAPSPGTRRRANTRARLVEAAAALVEETGTTRLGIDAVCERAGFTRGAFYSNFASVDALLFALYERKTARVLEALEEQPEQARHELGGSTLEDAVDRFLDVLPVSPRWYALRAVFSLRAPHDAELAISLREHADQLHRGLEPYVAGLVAAHGRRLSTDPAEATRVVVAAHVGATLQGILLEDSRRLRRDAVAAALRGVSEPAGDGAEKGAASGGDVAEEAEPGDDAAESGASQTCRPDQAGARSESENRSSDMERSDRNDEGTTRDGETAVQEKGAEREAHDRETARDGVGAGGEGPVLYGLTLFFPGGVHRVDPRTGAVEDLLTDLGETPDGIVVDPEAREAIFTFMGEPDEPATRGGEPPFTHRNGSLQTVSLDGGPARALLPRGSFTTGKQVTRDPESGRIYWCDREGCGVYRCEADGSGLTPLVLTAGTGPSPAEEQCVGVAVDPAAGFLYWTQKGPSKGGRGRIMRAGLELPEGEAPEARDDVEVLWQGLPEPIDLELDPASGAIYWTDRGAEPEGNTLNRAPIPAPGAPGEDPEILADGFEEAIGLALDRGRDVVYVSDLSGRIREIGVRDGGDRVVAELPAPVTGIALHWPEATGL
ncbi:TetR/AcrR family transcriptional regulator [Rothia halotolerans]|uniref:TetR/AcrR family transcriptional regulator n=1 Tax=Rothia halotolerans TaxID=405770 RepID=UPI0013EA2697|nr:TetR/AcrR family transcriptional regulator [Rothia halotolerans]